MTGIPADGTPKAVTLAPRTVSWVRFQAAGGSGGDVGLNEIEVWDDRDVAGYLEQRSGNWRNLFDPDTGFIRPRWADGRWLSISIRSRRATSSRPTRGRRRGSPLTT